MDLPPHGAEPLGPSNTTLPADGLGGGAPAPVPPARILVVCTANIARSPLGALVLQAHAEARLPDPSRVIIESAGIHADEGRRAARESLLCAEAWGRDISDHRSRPVTEELLATCDLVLTMTTKHRTHVVRMGPGLSAKTFTWLEFARLLEGTDIRTEIDPATRVRAATKAAHFQRPVRPAAAAKEDVKDPYGGPMEGFETMANLLADAADVMGPALFEVMLAPPRRLTGRGPL